MSSLNRCDFIGNLGRDIEVRTTAGGTRVANGSLGVTEKWTDRATGEKKEATEWVRFNVFGDGLIGVLERYTAKGSKVYISGRMKTRKWQDQSGADRYSTEINVDKVVLLDGPSAGRGSGFQAPAADDYREKRNTDFDDEIPF